MESPEINLHGYGQLIYNKEQRVDSKEKTVSSINDKEKTGQLHVKRKKLEHFLTVYTKTNSKTNLRP